MISKIKRYTKRDPASSEVQNIIRRMIEKQLEEFKGEEEFLNKLWDLRKSPKQSESLGLYPIDKEVLDFMERAYDIHISSIQNPPLDQGKKS